MNKVFIIGRLTKAPELKTTQNDISVATFTVAVSAANAFTLALKNCAATRWGLPHKASRQSIKVMMCLFFMVVILWKPTPEYSG